MPSTIVRFDEDDMKEPSACQARKYSSTCREIGNFLDVGEVPVCKFMTTLENHEDRVPCGAVALGDLQAAVGDPASPDMITKRIR